MVALRASDLLGCKSFRAGQGSQLVSVLHQDDKSEAGELMAGLLHFHELWLAFDVKMIVLQRNSQIRACKQLLAKQVA